MTDTSVRRYLVYRYGGHGLGHDLTAILTFARAAAETSRAFALDMSNFKYTPGDPHRRFFENYPFVLREMVVFLSDITEMQCSYQEPERYESPQYEASHYRIGLNGSSSSHRMLQVISKARRPKPPFSHAGWSRLGSCSSHC